LVPARLSNASKNTVSRSIASVCAGGIAEKNPLLMQIYADVTGCTMLVAGSSQACALAPHLPPWLAGAHPDFRPRKKR